MKDADLYNGIKAHDEAVFREFIDTYINLFYKIAIKVMLPVCSEDDIDDCISDSLSYIWFHIREHNPDKCSFRNWCSIIVHSRACNHLRCAKRIDKKREKVTSYLLSGQSHISSAEDEFFSELLFQNIRKCIFELSFPSNEIMIRRYIYGQPTKEISKALNLSIKQVENYLFKAKQKIRKKVNFDAQ